jgi:hypothetical protein
MFGQYFRIDFRRFGTFTFEKLNNRSHLLFGARLQKSHHFNSDNFSFYRQMALCSRTLLPEDFNL